ncbi:MAG: hypothetical protein IPG21_16520 [Saprospiraceae bacterium]|nr:hypothetical protein [Candidatus Vicinibacter affinis]
MAGCGSEKQGVSQYCSWLNLVSTKLYERLGLIKVLFITGIKAYSDHGVDGLAPEVSALAEGNGTAYHKTKKILWSYLR